MEKPVLPAVQPGDRLLGKYVVERVLGAGAMGQVVAVRHSELGELFAIKLMKPQALNNPEAIERFQREARASAKLKNAHAVKVHDVGRLEDGTPYMVMEHLAGRDLAAVIEAEGVMALERAAGFVLQALEALNEAHALGIVHRDIKPANLFLVEQPGSEAFLKVLDFGVAKHAKPDVAMDLTKTQAVLGSPFFMSPEQMASTRSVDRRTDLWALGVTLYQLTTGRMPFYAEAIAQLVQRVLTQEPQPPSKVNPALPVAFDAVMLRCLAKKPDQRYQSGEELAAALGPFAKPQAAASAPAGKPVKAAAMPAFGGQSRTELLDLSSVPTAAPALAKSSGSGSATFVLPAEPPPPPPLFDESGPKPVVMAIANVVNNSAAPASNPPPAIAAPASTPPAPARPKSWTPALVAIAVMVAMVALALAWKLVLAK